MDAWEPTPEYQTDADGFVLPPVRESDYPYIVAVCGGACYTAADRRLVRASIHSLLARKLRTHNVSFHLAPSPGAARIVYDMLGGDWKARGGIVSRGVELWGRAADFRSAWALMDCAHALIAFEPLDLIARYALHWAATVPDRNGVEGKGVAVRVVRRPEAAVTLPGPGGSAGDPPRTVPGRPATGSARSATGSPGR